MLDLSTGSADLLFVLMCKAMRWEDIAPDIEGVRLWEELGIDTAENVAGYEALKPFSMGG